MQELFKKYLDNECSPEEVKELLAQFDADENEGKLRKHIRESLEDTDGEDDERQWKGATDEMFAAISKHVTPEKGKVVPYFRNTWVRIAAAAVILVGGWAFFSVIKNIEQKQNIVKIETQKSEKGPGSNKASLTLADGSTIVLENATNGTITRQGNITIEKLAEGQLAYRSVKEKQMADLINRIATPRGGQYKVTLSDGTDVWLNAASSLRFPVFFNARERKVELSGEAYFEVAKAVGLPFKVEIAGKGEVEVLGTHFNINAYNEETTVKTTLLEGRVKVTELSSYRSRIINPGQEANLDGNGRISINKNANTEQAIAWKNGAFNFSNADLPVVLRQLSRWYDVDILFEGGVPQRKFSGEIQRDLKLSQVLKLLEKNNVFCKLENKTLVVLKQN